MNVGDYIKALRLSKGISQEELGKIVGVQKAAVYKWESGKVQNLKRATIQRLAIYFGVSPSSFISVSDEEKQGANTHSFLSPAEQQLINNYRHLNDEGQEKLLDLSTDLVSSGRYIKSNQPPMAQQA